MIFFAGGEYRYLPYAVPPTPFCDVAQKDKYFYPDFAKGSDFPADINDSCPVAIVRLIMRFKNFMTKYLHF